MCKPRKTHSTHVMSTLSVGHVSVFASPFFLMKDCYFHFSELSNIITLLLELCNLCNPMLTCNKENANKAPNIVSDCYTEEKVKLF